VASITRARHASWHPTGTPGTPAGTRSRTSACPPARGPAVQLADPRAARPRPARRRDRIHRSERWRPQGAAGPPGGWHETRGTAWGLLPAGARRAAPGRRGPNCVEATRWGWPLRRCMSGGVLLSHNLAVAVPSALKGLTSGFGMEPGVSLSLWPPKLYGVMVPTRRQPPGGGGADRPTITREPHSGRATSLCKTSPRPISTGRLRVSLPSTSGLSTQSSTGGLTRLTRWETSS
jgi:hypothetical protein